MNKNWIGSLAKFVEEQLRKVIGVGEFDNLKARTNRSISTIISPRRKTRESVNGFSKATNPCRKKSNAGGESANRNERF